MSAFPEGNTETTRSITSPEAYRLLEEEQGVAKWESRFDPISELVFTILSQHTSDLNAFKAYDKLIEAFGSWERVIEGDTEDIAQAIRIGGLSRIKAPRIKAVLQDIREKCGGLDLSFLREMPLEEAKAVAASAAGGWAEDGGHSPVLCPWYARNARRHPHIPG